MHRIFRKSFVAVALAALTWLVGCRRDFELASWDVDALVPIAHGELGLDDISTGDRITEGLSGLLYLKASDTLLNLGLDSLVGIPDTTFSDQFIIPIGGIQWPPGVPFYDSTTVTRYKLKQVQLTYAEIRTSLFTVKLSNSTRTQVLVNYRIPSATNTTGDTFMIQRLIPAKSSITEDFNLDGYRLDMRGRKGTEVNTIISEVEAMIDPANTSNYTFLAGEGFSVENTFKEIIPQYATGYFGNEVFSYQDSTKVELYETVDFEALEITAFNVNMHIDNGIGADLRLNLNALGSFNASTMNTATLNHEIIGQTQRFSRAINLYNPDDPARHFVRTIEFNQDNSNLDALFELNPSALFYDIEVETNPLGNISLGNDFVYYGHDLTASLDIEVPLRIGVQGLLLNDTFSVDASFQNQEQLVDGFLKLYLDNGFPFEAAIQLYLEDATDVVLDSLFSKVQVVAAASVDENGKSIGHASSIVEIPVNQLKLTNLQAADHIRMEARLDSYDKDVVEIYSDYDIQFKLVGDGKLLTK